MNKKNKLPTMKDVATHAGVSLGTVSKVFNGIPVGEEYKNKVDAAAKALGYHVNAYARGLRASKTNTVAIIMPNLANPFYANLADMCCKYLYKKGYRSLLATTSYDLKQEQEMVDMVLQNKVDGIIAITYNPDLSIDDEIPFVIIDRKFNNQHVPCVSSDNFSGGSLAAQKLAENGCKNLLFLGISSHVAGEADKRPLGFESYCNLTGIKHTIHRVFDEDGIEDIYKFIEDNTGTSGFNYDGIFCNNDQLALDVIPKLEELNIRIPEEVQIIGYDGIKRFGSDKYYCSTIRQPLDEMASMAVNTLLSGYDNRASALICLPVEYCFGGTTRF